jgi:hypothetical protein
MSCITPCLSGAASQAGFWTQSFQQIFPLYRDLEARNILQNHPENRNFF